MTMKKIILMAAVAMLAVTGVNAQSETKQEIAVSYGWLSNSDWLNVFEGIVDAVFGETYDEGSYLGPVSLEYFYNLEPWMGIGAIAVYGHEIEDSNKDGNKVGTRKNSYISLMPAVKFNWLRRDMVALYSKLGVGATWRSEIKEFEGENSKYNSDKKDFHVNWQVSVIGVEVGKQIRGFAEYGLGEQGMLQVGVRCRF